MTQVHRESAIPRAARFERPRPRLLARLVEAVDVTMVVLTAPSGFGKTTLLAQYARSTPRRVAWCRATGRQEGPVDVVARWACHLPELDLEPYQDVRTPDEVLARRLADALMALDQGIDLIVDNVEDERLARWLGTLADSLQEGQRLLLSCHSPEGLRLARRLADSSALILDTGDLTFDASEVQGYLEARGASLDPEQLRILSGWPAGLALSAHGVNRHAEVDDLVLEVLQALPPTVLMELPPLAPLDFWSEVEARQLSPALPADWLKTLLKAGLPLSPLGGGVFQPHHLLVRVLDQLLESDAGRARASRGKAARLTEASGALERASALYLQAGELTEALRLAEVLVPRYRDRGEHLRSRALLEALVDAPLPPVLQERLAWAQIETGSSVAGEASLQALKDAGRLTPAGFASLATVRGRQGLFHEQLALAQEGLVRVGDGPPVPALAWPLVFASLRLGHHAAAEAAAEGLVKVAMHGHDQVRLAEAWQLQGITWRHTRTASEATRPLIRARAVYEQLGWHGRAADLHLDELELLVRDGDIGGVAARLCALTSVVGGERAVHHARRLQLLAAVERRQGQPEQAEKTLERALQAAHAGGLNLEQATWPLEWVDCLLQQNRGEEAAKWLTAEGPAAWRIRRAVLLTLQQGQPLDLSLPAALGEPDAESRLRAVLLLAAQGAPEALEAAQVELRRNKHAPALSVDRALMGRLAGTPAAALLQPVAVRTGLVAPAPSHASPVLRVVTLGDLQVHLDGQPVQIGLAKARELLVWLAIHGSGSRDELVTALWDGSSEERHVEYFRVTVRRLRGSLKARMPMDLDPLPYAAGRYRLSPSLSLDLDLSDVVNSTWTRPFLPGVETEWARRQREQVFQQGLDHLLREAEASPPGRASDLYRLLLTVDPLLAVAHEGLIRILAEREEYSHAHQALRAYEGMLRAEYGVLVPASFLSTLPPSLTR